MNETVIFALLKDESVLCEKREYLGNIENCILGGSVETIDRTSDNYIQSAVMREAKEELGIEVRAFRKLGEFENEARLFHVVLVSDWTGDLPAINYDNNNLLVWISMTELLAQIKLPGLKALLALAAVRP